MMGGLKQLIVDW